MPKKILLFGIILMSFNLTFGQNIKYLELNKEQLTDLGFVFNSQGVMMKYLIDSNEFKDGHSRDVGYFNGFDGSGIISGNSKGEQVDSIILKNFCRNSKICITYLTSAFSKFSFYPIAYMFKDSSKKEELYFDKDTKTIPILLKQSDGNFKDKKDIIFFFKYSDELASKLNYVKDLNSYIYDYKFVPSKYTSSPKKNIKWGEITK